jgi:AcrR family transcriptional regulator
MSHAARERLLDAAERVVRTEGEQGLTVEAICCAAGVSEDVFAAVFADRDECVTALFDDVAERIGTSMLLAYQRHDLWLDGVRGAALELLAQLDSAPRLARMMIVGSAAGDSPLLASRARVLAGLARALEAGRRNHVADASGTWFGSEAAVGTVAAILHGRLREEPPPKLIELAAPLMGVVVLPYLGVEGARAELQRAPPQ